MTAFAVIGAQGMVSALGVTCDDAAHRALDRVYAAALEQRADPVGHQSSHYRPDEGAVLEDLDQALERNL
jgi:hypothetical protein